MTYGDASYASVPYAAGADFGTFSQARYRSLELLANRGIQALTPAPYRTLEVVANRGIWAQTAGLYRGLELLDNRAIQALVAGLYRALTTLESYTNDPMFPWLFALRPNQQYRSGQVALVGDGFGAAESTLGSSVLLGSVLENMGVVTWLTRSPGLYPCNAVSPNVFDTAIVVTVPSDAASGPVKVEESS